MNANPLLLSYFDAAQIVKQHASLLRSTWTPPRETVVVANAPGRVLALPVTADRDQPPFRRATRDGFACRSIDVGSSLRVVGQVRAGDPRSPSCAPIAAGEAVEIMTGAPVPEGADCVVMVEHATYDATGGLLSVDAGRTLQPGENIVQTGAEATRGAIILLAGTRIAANHVGSAAACGHSRLEVYARPQVAVIATGDELVELDDSILPYQIRNSNSYSLAAQIASAGGVPQRLPIAVDDRAAIEAAIRSALDCNLVLLSGGVSAGRFDFVEEVLLSLGAEFLFTGVLMQPGRPVVFGRIPYGGAHRYFFGLPGNPVSTLVTFALFARPLLDALAGADPAAPRFVQARLGADLNAKPGLTRFLPAILRNGSAFEAEVTVVPWQGSGDLASTAKANCFLVVPPNGGRLAAGVTVSVLLD